MELSFLSQASIWGQVFEIAVKRGVLQKLIHQELLNSEHPVLKPWQSIKNGDIYNQLVKSFNLTDPNAKEWVGTMVRHLLVLGYGLGWTAIREYLKQNPSHKAELVAIWCPLVLPGEQIQFDAEKETTAREFKHAFNLPGQPDLALVKTGQPARADFILWWGNTIGKKFQHSLLCLEFSYNAPQKLADFTTETPHREEINRYARYIDARGVFSRVCAEVEGEEFSLSSNIKNHLTAFSGLDKPLYKLCQASSYTERLIHLLRSSGKLAGACNARAIAITSNGFESISARFCQEQPEADPRTKLMKSLGEAYRNVQKISDDTPNELEQEIRVVFNKLVRSLPGDFQQQAQLIAQQPELGEQLHFQFHEQVESFYNPMQEIAREQAIAAIEETDALREFFGGNPQSHFTETLNQQSPEKPQIPLRTIHETAVISGLNSGQFGKINVIALEGNPGIGKTTAVMQFLQQQSQGFIFLYVSPRVVINRDVTKKLARKNGHSSGILTLTTNADLINSAPKWYQSQVKQQGEKPRPIDSAVVVDGIQNLNHPDCNTFFLTPELAHVRAAPGRPASRRRLSSGLDRAGCATTVRGGPSADRGSRAGAGAGARRRESAARPLRGPRTRLRRERRTRAGDDRRP